MDKNFFKSVLEGCKECKILGFVIFLSLIVLLWGVCVAIITYPIQVGIIGTVLIILWVFYEKIVDKLIEKIK